MTVDAATGRPLPSSDIREGQEVFVLTTHNRNLNLSPTMHDRELLAQAEEIIRPAHAGSPWDCERERKLTQYGTPRDRQAHDGLLPERPGGEQVLIITDDKKLPIGTALYNAAQDLGAEALLMAMTPRQVSGEEPPAAVAAAMKAADVVIAPMATSITHTRAKIEAAKAGRPGGHHAQHH